VRIGIAASSSASSTGGAVRIGTATAAAAVALLDPLEAEVIIYYRLECVGFTKKRQQVKVKPKIQIAFEANTAFHPWLLYKQIRDYSQTVLDD